MAGGIARLGDILGPGGTLMAPVSPNVFVNGRPIALMNCQYSPHPCCGAYHCPPTHCGGPTFDTPSGILVNGVPPITKSGRGLCGHEVRTASADVIIGNRSSGLFTGLLS